MTEQPFFDRTDPPHELFTRLAREAPDRLALRCPRGELTLRELDGLSDRIGWLLLSRDELLDRPAIFLLDDPILLLGALFAGLKTGIVSVVMDVSHPLQRIQELANDADPTVIVTESGTDDFARRAFPGIPTVRADLAEVSSRPLPRPTVDQDDPVSITFTSGSTGRPKGVVRTRSAVTMAAHDLAAVLGVRPGERVAPLFSPGFGAATGAMTKVILCGATLCLYPMKELSLPGLAAWLNDERINAIEVIPTLFRSLMKSLPSVQRFPSLRIVSIGGEQVTAQDVRLFQRFFPPPARMQITFASSEAATFVAWQLDANTRIEEHLVPVGYPLPAVRVRIVDDRGDDVPAGESGEIEVETDRATAGYWRDPELTAKRILPGHRPETRIVRTGDRGRILLDGRIVYLGRVDSQLKIRGARVDPLEVEMALLNLEALRQAAVVGKEGPGGLQLVAYFVAERAMEPSVLRASIASILPAHAIPSRFIQLDEVPLNPVGKVDRRALETRDDPPDADRARTDARGDEIEETLRSLWLDVLRRPSVGLDDGFFDVGGDSLRAAELFAAIERTWARAYPLAVIVDAGTVRTLAALIREDLAKANDAAEAAITVAAEEIERVVVDAWRRALDRSDLEADSDFFECGGAAASSLRARDEIAGTIGRRFPLALFVGFRTARALAHALARPPANLRVERSIERIRKGSGAPLFCFSGRGSDILQFRTLADHLDDGVSVYGIRGFGLDAGWLPPPDFELIVELTIDEIREIQPRGPYRFVGHSSGGQLALEVARRLRERGATIDLLAMIDTVPPEMAREEAGSLSGRAESLWRKLRAIAAEPRDHLRDWRRKRARETLEALDLSREPDRWRDVGAIYLEATLHAEHEPWDGDVVFFVPESSVARRHRVGWEDLLPNLEVVPVPGGHVSALREPHVVTIAREIGMRLTEADEQSFLPRATRESLH